MRKFKILLVEDEPFLAKVTLESLQHQGYEVKLASDGKKAYNAFLNESFDLLIFDVMLPQLDGFSLAKQVRKVDQNVPILFLTAKLETNAVVEGYQSGGNDYLKKPFSLEELFVRVNELLKRNYSGGATAEDILLGNYCFSYHRQELVYGESVIGLSHREAELLFLLASHKNQPTDRKMALMALWGDDSFFNTRSMDVFISKLRKHLQNDARVQILNLRGVGYKLICP